MHAYLQNLKKSFLEPSGDRYSPKSSRWSWIKAAENRFGTFTVPTIAGIGAGMLAASGGLALGAVVAVGATVGLVAVPVTYAFAYAGGWSKGSAVAKFALTAPYVLGLLLGRAVGWTAYSLTHPRETLKEIKHGQAPKPRAIITIPENEVRQTVVHVKPAFDVAKAEDNAPKSAAPDFKKGSPKP
jgi:hypothetical protein